MDWPGIAVIISVIMVANGAFVWAVKWLLTSDQKNRIKEFDEIRGAIGEDRVS